MKVQRTCPICGKVYKADSTRLRHGRQTTCSRACSYSLRGGKRATSTEITCTTCGSSFTRPPSQMKSRHGGSFCSTECHYKGRGLGHVQRIVEDGYDLTPEGRASLSVRRREANFKRKAEGRYGHTEETRKKLSASTAKAIAEGRIPRISKFEREVGVVLRSLGVKAQPQHGIRDAQGRFRAVLDFWLPELGVGVEANGTFWHADPRVFPQGPEHASQKRTAERYARKMALLNLRGVPVIEVWEKDFREDPKGAVQDALRGLNAPGD